MLRKPMIGVEPNPFDLKELPVDKKFWQDKDIAEIKKLLWDALINKNADTALPAHDDLPALLMVIDYRLRDLITDEVVKSCERFACHLQLMREEINASQLGERYLQVSAIVSFYRGHYAQAAQFAGLLGDAYFLRARLDTDSFSSHFNLIAALAYQQRENVEEASHHFNQYLHHAIGAFHQPEEVSAATAYLLEHHTLVTTNGLLTVLANMAGKCGDNQQLASQLRRQSDRADEQVIYEDLDRRKSQAHLQELHIKVRDQLQTLAAANQQTSHAAASTNGLFAATADVAADAVAPEAPRYT